MTDKSSSAMPFWQRIGILAIVIRSIQLWLDKHASSKGAALALYMMFSLAPILLLVVAVAGWLFGEDEIRTAILHWVEVSIGTRGAETIATVMSNAHYAKGSHLATWISIGVMMFSATTAFTELKTGLDDIWDAPKNNASLLNTVRSRLIAFTVVLALASFLAVTLLAEGALALVRQYWPVEYLGAHPDWFDGRLMSQLISFAAFIALFAAILKLLPNTYLRWRDVLPGAALTAVLFLVGKYGIGVYLGSGTLLTAYGAAGSLVAFLAWIYFSALIFYFGATFTRAYYERYTDPSYAQRGVVNADTWS